MNGGELTSIGSDVLNPIDIKSHACFRPSGSRRVDAAISPETSQFCLQSTGIPRPNRLNLPAIHGERCTFSRMMRCVSSVVDAM